MKLYSYNELTQDAQERATGLYWAHPDVTASIDAHQAERPEDPILFGECANLLNWRFNKAGTRIETRRLFQDGTITIEVSGGCVVDVSGLPEGWTYELNDHDV